jgi:importin-7
LSILESDQDPGVKQSGMDFCDSPRFRFTSTDIFSAVIYLKNRVMKGWSPADDFTGAKPIEDTEKSAFRSRLVPILVSSPTQIRVQLIAILQKILSSDFPAKWPEFLDLTVQLLNGSDANSVFAGEQCLIAICKIYRFISGEQRRDFDRIVAMTFPQVLNIGNGLVNETSPEAGEMLHAVVKIFKHAIYVSNSLAYFVS